MAQKNILFYEKYNDAVMLLTQQVVFLHCLSQVHVPNKVISSLIPYDFRHDFGFAGIAHLIKGGCREGFRANLLNRELKAVGPLAVCRYESAIVIELHAINC